MNDIRGSLSTIERLLLFESATQQAYQAELLRTTIENPVMLPVRPPWLDWRGCLVADLRQGIVQEKAFERLAILANALEVAGCEDAELPHLYGP